MESSDGSRADRKPTPTTPRHLCTRAYGGATRRSRLWREIEGEGVREREGCRAVEMGASKGLGE
jgi:hypothetical protein